MRNRISIKDWKKKIEEEKKETVGRKESWEEWVRREGGK